MIRHCFFRFALIPGLVFSVAPASSATAADPTAAEITIARKYIDTRMTPEQRALLEQLAEAGGKSPEAFLIGLIGNATLGEKSPEPDEPGSPSQPGAGLGSGEPPPSDRGDTDRTNK